MELQIASPGMQDGGKAGLGPEEYSFTSEKSINIQINRLFGIVEKLVKAYQPKKIYLFGSFAWGQPKSDSDLDILIIVDHSEQKPYKRMKPADLDPPFNVLLDFADDLNPYSTIFRYPGDFINAGKLRCGECYKNC